MTTHPQNGSSQKATVLYLTFSGFHEMETTSSFGEIATLLGRCFSFTDPIIRLYSGKPYKYMGESALAFFGLNEDGNRPSVNAVKSAIELQNKFSELKSENDFPETIGFKIGIFSGEIFSATIGAGAERQENYFGEAIQLAAHICSLAMPGQILVGEETRKHATTDFSFNALEPVPVKGYKKPIAIYEVTVRKSAPTEPPLQSGRIITSSMVGRQQDSRLLEEQIKQLLNGRGGVITIEGIAGIGKSRLMAEIRQKEIIQNVAFFEGRALSEGKNLSFHPIIQIIKSWSGIKEDDKPATAFQKLSANIIRIYPEQASEIIPFVATMMGYPLEGEAMLRLKGIEGEALERLILKNIRDLLSRAAFIRPVVIMIEDAHWADLSSISFMESLFKLVKIHRLLFVNVFRPKYKETGERLKSFLKENLPEHYREITVLPLNENESAELIGNLLNQTNLPDDIKQLILLRSEGNPFFIEEVLRSFIDEGLIEIREGIFIITDRVQYANIPETIDKVILSRIDRLDEKTKGLLRTASVIGRNFYYKVLEEAAQTIEELDTRLEYLKEAQLLNEYKHKEDVEFLFKHALAQQATYDSILLKTKKELHLKIARSIEKVFADKLPEFYGVLAMHYGKAEVTEKREEYIIKAGEQSLITGASSEAVNFFKEALESYLNSHKNEIDISAVVHLQEKIGIALQTKGENMEAIEYIEKVLEHNGFKIPKRKTIRLLKAFFYFLIFPVLIRNRWMLIRIKPDDRIEKIIRMIIVKGEALSTTNPGRWIIESIYALKFYLKYEIFSSDYTAGILSSASTFYTWTGFSIETGRIMLEIAEKIIREKENYFLYNYRMAKRMYDYYAGVWTDDNDLDNVYVKGNSIGAIFDVIIYLLHNGLIFVDKGDQEKANQVVDKLNEIYNNFENTHARAQAFRLMMLNYVRYRRLSEGLQTSDEAIRFTIKTGHLAMLLVIFSQKSIAHSLQGEVEEARRSLQEAEKLVKERKLIRAYYSGYLLAACYLKLAELKKVPEDKNLQLNHLLQLTKKLINTSKVVYSNLAEGYRIRANVFWMLNKQNKAFGNFEKSIEIAERFGTKPELARTCFELGKCLMEINSKHKILRSKNGSEYLLMAKRMFEEMDLQWDLKEYDKYMEN